MWQSNITIINNTGYNLTIGGVGPGNITIDSNSQTSWSSEEVHNTKSLLFWITPNVWYVQGNLSFGPEAGVYVDRGWMADNDPYIRNNLGKYASRNSSFLPWLSKFDQTIDMVADANGKTWTQTQNGGETLLAWNEFEQGGNISLTFTGVTQNNP